MILEELQNQGELQAPYAQVVTQKQLPVRLH
jgi:hypothetical protein